MQDGQKNRFLEKTICLGPAQPYYEFFMFEMGLIPWLPPVYFG